MSRSKKAYKRTKRRQSRYDDSDSDDGYRSRKRRQPSRRRRPMKKQRRTRKRRSSGGRRGNARGMSAIKWIGQRASELYQGGSGVFPYKNAVKQASADYRRDYKEY